MNINETQNPKLVCEFSLSKDRTVNEIKWEIPFKEQKLDNSRIYIIVVDGEILKIGASQSDGGIKNTLSIYRDGGVKGRPSIRSYGIYFLINQALRDGHKVQVYLILEPKVDANIIGLNKTKKIKTNISVFEAEKLCKDEYFEYPHNENEKYPVWNFQENGKDWPEEIKEAHAHIIQESLMRKKKKGRK